MADKKELIFWEKEKGKRNGGKGKEKKKKKKMEKGEPNSLKN